MARAPRQTVDPPLVELRRGRWVTPEYRDEIVSSVDAAPAFSSATEAKLRALLSPSGSWEQPTLPGLESVDSPVKRKGGAPFPTAPPQQHHSIPTRPQQGTEPTYPQGRDRHDPR